MPMGGNGFRFSSLGYKLPKPLIPIQGKPFFYWATKSLLNSNVKDLTFVILQEHVDNFHLDKKIFEYFPDAKLVILPAVLNGAVLTCLQGVKDIKDELPIIFNDCDHAFKSTQLDEFLQSNIVDISGGLLTFNSNLDKYSYIEYNEEGNIVGTVEKKVVSNDAICGAYYFKDTSIFKKYARLYLDNCDYNEFYISGVYNEMCKDNKVIKKFATDFHLSFGTPDEYLEIKDSKDFKRF